MKFRLKCESPADIEFTLMATMTAGQWEQVRERLDKGETKGYEPAGQLISAINDLLAQARKIYWAKENAHTSCEKP